MRPEKQIKTGHIEEPGVAVWAQRYRAAEFDEPDLDAGFLRVVEALAQIEGRESRTWAQRFGDAMCERRFIPAGRILAGAGRKHSTTLANCFVMGTIEDSIDGIFSALKESAVTLQAGGGIGIDVSTIRPRGTAAVRTGGAASGPVSFLQVWNQMSETVLSTSARRGAMMAVIDCDHPDVLAFASAKQDPQALQHFNISVLITDAFMHALQADDDWTLRFGNHSSQILPAREVWESILANNREGGEPGVLFIDRINLRNRLAYCEQLRATNPCGELPLPPYGACLLGSLILPQFVTDPFKDNADVDWHALETTVGVGVRMLDNACDLARFPLQPQSDRAMATRRIGMGVTGLADMLIMLGLHYDSDAGRNMAMRVMQRIRDVAYRASCELAQEKGSFAAFEAGQYLGNDAAPPLPEDIRADIHRRGLRNSHLTAIAPTGSISLLADNVSSGIEPVFDWSYRRRFLLPDGTRTELAVEDFAWRHYRKMFKGVERTSVFQRGTDTDSTSQVRMVGALQPFVDSGISKTIGLTADAPLSEYDALYRQSYNEGLKGITTFPEAAARGTVLLPPEHCHAGTGERCD
ncbi:MAG: adenosylcobalamin-dependent ribonucleoside-diphosphate reductase [Proteobacteria bacterium]|nr:adenosylcobalamin-dependent ribonucleoside-diphosphate reductase [Pseudomonadota bacterium]